jgi:N-methylhydantoinase A
MIRLPRTLVGIDLGGTFTGACAWDGRTLRTAKAPSTPGNPEAGVQAVIDQLQQSSGGQISMATAGRQAIRRIPAGPAGGVLAALAVGRQVASERLICCDVGGTTAHLVICQEKPTWTPQAIEDGWSVRVPLAQICTINLGGGLTDANVLLGRIRPGFLLGGRMPKDSKPSGRTRAALGEQARTDPATTALNSIRGANDVLKRAVQRLSSQTADDVRTYTLVSFGGAGGLHACALAGALGVRKVIVPAHAGVLCALGMVQADMVRDYCKPLGRQANTSLPALRRAFAEMMEAASADLQALGFDQDDGVLEQLADMRYRGDSNEVTVPVESLTDLGRLLRPFHAAHARRYGFASEHEPVEIVNLRTRCIIETPKPAWPQIPATDGRLERALIETAEIHFDSGALSTPIYDRSCLRSGDGGEGAALIVEPFATTLILPGWEWRVHDLGHLLCSAC